MVSPFIAETKWGGNMRKSLIILLASVCFAGAARADNIESPKSFQPEPSKALVAHMEAGGAAVSKGNMAVARQELLAVVQDPEFAAWPAKSKNITLVMLGYAEVGSGDMASAYAHLSEAGGATGNVTDRAYYWAMTLAAFGNDHKDQSVETLIAASKVSPEVVSSFPYNFLKEMALFARRKDDDRRTQRRLLEALWSAHYTSPEIYQSPESLWFELFEAEVAAGNDTLAREVLMSFREPETVIKLRCDKRYARFLSESPEQGDFQTRLDASLVTARQLMEKNPRSVEAVNNLAYRLVNANHLEEALSLSEEAITRATSANDAPAYDDQTEKLQWLYMDRSIALGRLNRTEDRVLQQEKARDSAIAGGKGSDNVSQPINLGGTYVAEGRPKEALAVMADVDNRVSAYGKMAATGVRACAYKQLHDQTKLDEAMAYLKANGEDGYGPYRGALMCTGDADGLAQLMIARLENPLTRNQTLYWMQGFLTAPRSDYDRALIAVCQKAIANTQLQAAVNRYGNIEHYAMFKPIDD